MRIAIIGSSKFDSLEFNLDESFKYNNIESKIFDIHNSMLYSARYLSKYFVQLDFLGRRYSDKYDKSVFDKICKKVLDYMPDVVICVYRFVHPAFVQKIKDNNITVVHVNPDALTTFEYQQVFASNYDVWFTKDPYIVSFMKNNMNLNAKYYNEAFNSRLHNKPSMSKRECEEDVNIDVMTYGTMYPYRARMLEQIMKNDIEIKVFGVKPNRFYDSSLDNIYQNKYITGLEKSQILYGSKIVFNQMHYAEIESLNNRFFEVNGSGAFQISDYRPILKDILPVDPELVTFRTIDEGIDKIKYYLKNPSERYEISDKIYKHFVDNFTYDHLTKYILDNI